MKQQRHLKLTIERIWEKLIQASNEASHPWRMCALATGEPGVRMMVLRGANSETRALKFFTDRRSLKIAALRAQPRAEVLFWSAKIREQIRLQVMITVHENDTFAAEEWQNQPDRAWLEYSTVAPPGQEIDSTKIGEARRLSRESAQENFAVLRCAVTQISWMRLGPAAEHVRIRFKAEETGWSGVYLA